MNYNEISSRKRIARSTEPMTFCRIDIKLLTFNITLSKITRTFLWTYLLFIFLNTFTNSGGATRPSGRSASKHHSKRNTPWLSWMFTKHDKFSAFSNQNSTRILPIPRFAWEQCKVLVGVARFAFSQCHGEWSCDEAIMRPDHWWMERHGLSEWLCVQKEKPSSSN